VRTVELGPLSDVPLKRVRSTERTDSKKMFLDEELDNGEKPARRRETVGGAPTFAQSAAFLRHELLGGSSASSFGPRPRRLTKSWCPGSQRKEVFQPLRPANFNSFAPGQTEQDFAESRTFGGIDRQIRTKMPTRNQFLALSSYMKVFRAQTESMSRRPPKIVAFVNSRSGGQAGRLIMRTLLDSLRGDEDNAICGSVCDLSGKNEPEATVENIAEDMSRSNAQEIRLIVCGGDGTVTWILSALENCKKLREKLHLLPVAIVPLGTGNDLARSLGWGPKLRAVSDILWYLKWVVEAEPVTLDQWRIVLRPHVQLPEEHKLRTCGSHPQLVTDPQLSLQLLGDLHEALDTRTNGPADVYLGFWQNYFSVGVDAKVARHVDVSRSHSRCGKCCFRRGCGKVCYAWQALMHAACGTVLTNVIRKFKVAPPGSEDENLVDLRPGLDEIVVNGRRGRMRQMMFVNINSYGSGLQVMPDCRVCQYIPSPGDGILEVLGVRNMLAGLGFFAGLTRPTYLTSAEAVAFTLQRGECMQLDGEPWGLDYGADVMVELHKKVTMLRAPREARFWKGHVTQNFWSLAPEPEPTSIVV